MMSSSFCAAQKSQLTDAHFSGSYDNPLYFNHRIEDTIHIDGLLDDTTWLTIPWTRDFIDIEGDKDQVLDYQTRVKMCWNTDYLYIAAELQDDHIWANLTDRDDHVYQDDAFEIFIDPDGDGHNYMELQVNALNTVCDLLMLSPYKIDNGIHAISTWRAHGLKHAVHIKGTLNDPSDIDTSWTVEVAIPIPVIQELSSSKTLTDLWRTNFYRVDWPLEIVDVAYRHPLNNHNPPRANYTAWSPTGDYDTHRPDQFGYTMKTYRIAHTNLENFELDSDESIKTALWDIFYQLKSCLREHKPDACTLQDLSIPSVALEGYRFKPQLSYNPIGFDLYTRGTEARKTILINEKGLLRTIATKDVRP
jgi:hypothetical protein